MTAAPDKVTEGRRVSLELTDRKEGGPERFQGNRTLGNGRRWWKLQYSHKIVLADI